MLLIKCLLLITFVLGPSTSLVDHVTNIENNLTPDHKLGSLVLYIYKSKQKKTWNFQFDITVSINTYKFRVKARSAADLCPL